MTTSWPPQNLPTSTQHRDPLAVIAAMLGLDPHEAPRAGSADAARAFVTFALERGASTTARD